MVRIFCVLALLSFGLAGCSPFLVPPWTKTETPKVRSSLFGEREKAVTKRYANYPARETGTALRVDQMGRKILAKNPQIGLKPVFATIGVDNAEIYHVRPNFIHITEGLVKKCRTDTQLAALLCLQLGKMVAERDALATATMRHGSHLPPIEVPIGHSGAMSNADGTHMVELAKYEKVHPRRRKNDLPPNPTDLATIYLTNTGFPPTALQEIAPLVDEAQSNYSLEKHFNNPWRSNWIP